MFGYACDETKELMPLPIMLAHKLVRQLSEMRRSGKVPYLRPDEKSQVSVEYVEGKPKRVDAMVLSTQHDDEATSKQIEEDIRKFVIQPVRSAKMIDSQTKFHIDPDRQLCDRRTTRRYGLTGRENHRRYLRWHGTPWRWRFLRKGPDEGRPVGVLRGRYVAKNLVRFGTCCES